LSRALDLGIGQVEARTAVALQPASATCCENLQVVAILGHVHRVLPRVVVPCASRFGVFRQGKIDVSSDLIDGGDQLGAVAPLSRVFQFSGSSAILGSALFPVVFT
jgi:hypothetical protein